VRIIDPVAIGCRTSPSRIVFGAHVTNLAKGRAISEDHVAYYERRAAGGCGVIVVETASVHPSDWPYERAPLASLCAQGWLGVAQACDPYGTLVLAGLGHCGAQGSSAYSGAALWAPSPVVDPQRREMPREIGPEEIAELVTGFERAAALARASGLGGVEIDAGPFSILRQFRSPLTNRRSDRYGTDRLALCREVLLAAREGVGGDGVVALRLSCDELADWGGITPERSLGEVDALADLVDLVVVVRGGSLSTEAYRPREHAGQGFNRAISRQVGEVLAGRAAVAVQGSIVDLAMAEALLGEGAADLVEMTRAQIAEPRLVELVRLGCADRIRPCVLCNQACTVRDTRNVKVSCIGEPSSGHEATEVSLERSAGRRGHALVVGGGPAGLECARVLASYGQDVTVLEATDRLGGALCRAARGPGRQRLALLAGWLEAECRRLGVAFELGTNANANTIATALAEGSAVVLATGSRFAPERLVAVGLALESGSKTPVVLDALAVLDAGVRALPEGPLVVDDPLGGPIGVALAEWLATEGRDVAIVTPDEVVGVRLGSCADLVSANRRLANLGVHRERRCRIVGAEAGAIVLADRFTAERRSRPCSAVIDCGARLAVSDLSCEKITGAGDCVAPRSVLEAVLEGRRRALEIVGAASAGRGDIAGSSV
jgi:mycofactocin system FadH/OYE family oxidoreductase 1